MNRVLKTALLSGIFLTSSLASSDKAFSEEKGTYTTNKVTVVATRTAQDVMDVPAMVDVIDVDSASNKAASDVQGLFKDTPSVQFSGGPRRNGQDPAMRGYDTNSILKLLDGTRLNYEAAHDGQFFIDPNMLKRVEVVRGANSSIYGGGAMGGVIAFETKDAKDLLKPGQKSGMTTGISYKSANQEIAPTVTGYRRGDDFDAIANINYRKAGDIKQGNGAQLDADDNILNGLGKINWFIDDESKLTLSFIGFNGSSREPNNGTQPVNTTDNFASKKKSTQHVTSVSYNYNPDSNLINFDAKVYYNDTDVEETVITTGRLSSRQFSTLGFNLDNQSKFYTSDIQNILSYGFEYYTDEQDSFRSTGGGTPGVPNGEAESFGFYVQDEISLGDLTVIPAVRFDDYETKSSTGTKTSDNEVSPKIAAIYDVTEWFNVFGSYARAFRAPKLTELYPSGIHFPRFVGSPPVFAGFNTFLTNPNLQPETSDSYEIGTGFDFNSVIAEDDSLKFKAVMYRTEAENFISQSTNVNGGANTQYLNAREAEINGFEVDLNYDSPIIIASAGISYSNAYDTFTDTHLEESQPLTLVTNIGYKINEIDSVIGWRGTFADETDNVPSASTKDGFSAHDIYFDWAPTEGEFEGVGVNLSITNIFDKAYQPNFSGLYEEGVSYNAAVTYSVALN